MFATVTIYGGDTLLVLGGSAPSPGGTVAMWVTHAQACVRGV